MGGTDIVIVEDYKIGNTRIKIADDYCSSKNDKDVEKILHRVAVSTHRHFREEQKRENAETA